MTLPACSHWGQGRTAVLMLHGIGGARWIWGEEGSGTGPALAAAGYRALAIDLPGYGDSAALQPVHMDHFVAAARAVMGQEAATHTVLLGHSMGGMVVQELLARAPGGVDGVVLACTSAAFGKPDGAWQAQFIAERLAPLDAGVGMAGMAARLVPALVSPAAPAAALATAQRLMAKVPEATYRAALCAIAAFDRREAVAAIAVPTLLLAAEHDRTAPPAVMQRLAGRVRGAEYVCLALAGHMANLEVPLAFNGALLSFLQRHFPPP